MFTTASLSSHTITFSMQCFSIFLIQSNVNSIKIIFMEAWTLAFTRYLVTSPLRTLVPRYIGRYLVTSPLRTLALAKTFFTYPSFQKQYPTFLILHIFGLFLFPFLARKLASSSFLSITSAVRGENKWPHLGGRRRAKFQQ